MPNRIQFDIEQEELKEDGKKLALNNNCWSYAWKMLKEGKKVKLPSWSGYWQLEHGEIMMYLKDGEVVNIRNTEYIVFTFDNIAKCNWMVVD